MDDSDCFRSEEAFSSRKLFSRIRFVASRLSHATFAVALLSACAADAQPSILQQTTRVGLHGEGRDVSAEFRFICAPHGTSPPPEAVVYRPSVSGLAYVAQNRQALVATAVGKNSDSLCSPDPRARQNPEWQKVPLLIWINNLDRPAIVDVVEASSLQAYRKYGNYPPLADYSFDSLPTSSHETRYKAPVTPLTGDISAIFGERTDQSIQLLSPLVLRATVTLENSSARRQFEKMLGPEISPGVRSIDLCALKSTLDGQAFFRKRGTIPVECSTGAKAASPLPENSVQFSLSRPALSLTSGHWSFADPIGSAVSYIRSDGVEIRGVRKTASHLEAQSTDFWKKNVRKISIRTSSGHSSNIPTTVGSAYYISGSNIIYIVLGDVEIVYFRNIIEGSRR